MSAVQLKTGLYVRCRRLSKTQSTERVVAIDLFLSDCLVVNDQDTNFMCMSARAAVQDNQFFLFRRFYLHRQQNAEYNKAHTSSTSVISSQFAEKYTMLIDQRILKKSLVFQTRQKK